MADRARGTRGFTLLDTMIVVVILGILAAVTVPLVSKNLEEAQDSAAKATYSMVRKGLDLYFQKHTKWPSEVVPSMFTPPEEVAMPRGYQLEYTPASGELELLEVEEADEDDEPAIVVVS